MCTLEPSLFPEQNGEEIRRVCDLECSLLESPFWLYRQVEIRARQMVIAPSVECMLCSEKAVVEFKPCGDIVTCRGESILH